MEIGLKYFILLLIFNIKILLVFIFANKLLLTKIKIYNLIFDHKI